MIAVSLLQVELRFKVAEGKVTSGSIVGFDLFGAYAYSHRFSKIVIIIIIIIIIIINYATC